MEKESVKSKINEAVKDTTSIEEVKIALLSVLRELRSDGAERIGYVAGLITSEGPENIDKNVKRLSKFADSIRSESNFPIFASTDIITDYLFKKLGLESFQKADWEKFWDDVLSAGFVTDIYMTPRWESSRGSRAEHKTAKRVNLQIHYIKEEV